MHPERTRLKRFGWLALFGMSTALGIYLTPLFVIARITEADIALLQRRPIPAFDSRPFLGETGSVQASGVYYDSNGFYLYPFFLDDIYRPILNRAGRSPSGKPNWIAVYLLGVKP